MRSSLVLAALLTATSLARAEPTKADQLFNEGKQLSDKNDWEGACKKFEQAIQLDSDAPGTMLNLGRCNERLGRIGTALGWYEKAEEHAQKNNMPEYQKAAQERKAELAPRVPSLRFEFSEPLPAGGRLFVDHTEVAAKDQARLSVDPGHHTVDVEAPHKTPIHQEVDVKERDDRPVRIAAFTTAGFVDPGAAQRRRAYLFGGIGAGLFVGQGIVGFSGKIYYDNHTTAGSLGTWNNTIAPYVLTSVAVVGVAGLAYGAYLYLTAPKPYEADRASAWVPIAAPDEVGIAYVGRF